MTLSRVPRGQFQKLLAPDFQLLNNITAGAQPRWAARMGLVLSQHRAQFPVPVTWAGPSSPAAASAHHWGVHLWSEGGEASGGVQSQHQPLLVTSVPLPGLGPPRLPWAFITHHLGDESPFGAPVVTTCLCHDRGQPQREQAWAGGAGEGAYPAFCLDAEGFPPRDARKLALRWPFLPGRQAAGKVPFTVIKKPSADCGLGVG